MAFYCELPNEQICDIGWERLFCTEQWLEDRIREIRGYSRERRVELGTNSFQNFARFSVEVCSGDHETLVATLGGFSAFALGISYMGRNSVTQAWKDAKKGKDMSKHGFKARLQALGVKILPHSVVMDTWLRQQELDE